MANRHTSYGTIENGVATLNSSYKDLLSREDDSTLAGEDNSSYPGEESAILSESDLKGSSQERITTTHAAGISNFETIMHLIKSNLGTGILAMPNAFTNSGILVGGVGLVFLGIICVYCMQMLVKISHTLCKRLDVPSLDYAQVGDAAFTTFRTPSTNKTRKYGTIARATVNVFLILTQLGACCVYLLFMAQNIMKVIKELGYTQYAPDKYLIYYELGLLIVLIPFSYIRNIKRLAPFSMLANVATVCGLLIIGYYITILHPLPDVSTRPLFAGWRKLPLYFGTAIYAFEGIGLILPLENKIKDKSAFTPVFGVLNVGMAIVAVLYLFMGFYGYLQFGDDAAGTITVNLTKWYGITVEIIFTLCIFVCYGLQFYVPVQILQPYIERTTMSRRLGGHKLEYIIRTLLVIGTFGVAAAVHKYLNLLISVIGALASTGLALIFPPILELVTLWPGRSTVRFFKLIFIKNVIIMTFGLFGCVIGSVLALKELAEALSKPRT